MHAALVRWTFVLMLAQLIYWAGTATVQLGYGLPSLFVGYGDRQPITGWWHGENFAHAVMAVVAPTLFFIWQRRGRSCVKRVASTRPGAGYRARPLRLPELDEREVLRAFTAYQHRLTLTLILFWVAMPAQPPTFNESYGCCSIGWGIAPGELLAILVVWLGVFLWHWPTVTRVCGCVRPPWDTAPR